MEKTNSYTYFAIKSNGDFTNGFAAYENAIFDSDEITCLLGIQPFSCWAYGDKRVDGSVYRFSAWSAEKSGIRRLDAEAQCRETIRNLKNRVAQLDLIKEKYDMSFILTTVPSVFGDEKTWLSFDEEIIEFCYLTCTTIDVDMYIYPFGDEL